MNAAQLRKYRFEWAQARRWLRANGRTPEQADAVRHAVHRQKLGRDKSSLDFTNGDLTKVLAGFRAIYDGGNLNAQLAAEDDPERRVAALRADIDRLAGQCGIEGESLGLEAYFQHWFKGRSLEGLDERALQQLRGLLERRAAQLTPAGDAF